MQNSPSFLIYKTSTVLRIPDSKAPERERDRETDTHTHFFLNFSSAKPEEQNDYS